MEAPFISLVINNFNYAEFLRQCIQSCLDQDTDISYEVVVVDDGSTDASRQVIESFDSEVKSVYQMNGGQAAAFTAGWRAAAGAVIWFVDSDDLLLPTSVQTVADAWIPGTSFSQGGLKLIDRQGTQVGLLHSNEWLEAGDVWSRILTRSNHSFVYSPTSGIAFSRDALQKSLPLQEDLWRTSADGMLVHLAAAHGPVVKIPEVIAEYRLHGANAWADVQFSANRDHGTEWNRRLRLHELLRLCGVVEMISTQRRSLWDFTFAVDMYSRAIELFDGLESDFWSTSRISKRRVAEALNAASSSMWTAMVERNSGPTGLQTPSTPDARSISGYPRAIRHSNVTPDTPIVMARAREQRASDLQALRNLPVWDVINSAVIRRPDKWPHGAAWSRGFSRHAWNPAESAPYNLAPHMQLRLRVPGNNAAMVYLLVGANVDSSSTLRLEVTCNGSRLPPVDFTGLARVCVPSTGDDCLLIELKVSVNTAGRWRNANAQEFYLLRYAVLPAGNSGSVSVPLRPEYPVADLSRPIVATAWVQHAALRGLVACVGNGSMLVAGAHVPVRLSAPTHQKGGEVRLLGVRCVDGSCLSRTDTQQVSLALPSNWISEREVLVPLPDCQCIKSVGMAILTFDDASADDLTCDEGSNAGVAVQASNLASLRVLDEVKNWPMTGSSVGMSEVDRVEAAVLDVRLAREWLWRADLQGSFDIVTASGRRDLLHWSQVQGSKERADGTFDLESEYPREVFDAICARRQFDHSTAGMTILEQRRMRSRALALVPSPADLDEGARLICYRNAFAWMGRLDLQATFPLDSAKWMNRMNEWWNRYGRVEFTGRSRT